ncbi:MAG: thermonuclease family protein [Solirubrobacterales bacterium]
MLAGRGPAGAIVLFLLLAALILFGDEESETARTGGGSASGIGARAGEVLRGQVMRVVDGDTIEVSLDGVETDVRYIGVDTPESVKPGTPVECFAKEAAGRNRELVEGERVRLEVGTEPTDRFGRLLAYVFVGDTLVNAELVEGGYARTLEIPPNTERADRFERLQRKASAAGAGLWGAC